MIELVNITPDAERAMAYMARVSSSNQDNPDIANLLKYCLDHGHWSVFEQAHATFEIITSRMISAQILRHRSFTFQEFSQRYAEAQSYISYTARRQDTKNRQNSIDDLPDEVKNEWLMRQQNNWQNAMRDYSWALSQGIAKECARAVLPMQTATRLYMTGSIRSWIHYFQVRCAKGTQQEHRALALDMRRELAKHLPIIAEALEWL